VLNTAGKITLALCILVSVGLVLKTIVLRYRLLRLGKSKPPLDQIGLRLRNFVTKVLFQKSVLERPLPGLMHALVFWGLLVFVIAAVNRVGEGFSAGFSIFFGARFGDYYWGLVDLFGVLVLIGILALGFRRYVLRPDCLKPSSTEFAAIIVLITALVFTYMLGEAFRMALDTTDADRFRFAGAFIARVLTRLELSDAALRAGYMVCWWTPILAVLFFTFHVPSSKHMHLIACPFNEFFASLKPKGELATLDLEDETAESFGVAKINEFTWKDLLDLHSCVECGRCQDNCPAHLSDKPLSPKLLIRDLKHHLLEVGPRLLQEPAGAASDAEQTEGAAPIMPGEVISDDTLWACTTCFACVEHCPIAIEQMSKIVDMRRYLVLMESRFPQEAVTVFKNIEANSNPWGIGWAQRADWAKELGLKKICENPDAELLFWVGCSGAFDERSKKVSAALVKILRAAGVDFAILGEEEKCCGDSARRLGNEYLYQILARENVETLNKYNVRNIVTTCPHGFNTLKNEYPKFGGNYEVVHHTQLITELIRNGRVKLTNGSSDCLVYHDSCYLGRYNDIYEEPREALKAVGYNITPLERQHRTSFCCGAGGGRMWLEENLGKRINEMRSQEIAETDVGLVATACPFCLTMIEDGMKELGKAETVCTKDIAEIVAERLAGA
jgi:Fe-S oxidoreductase